MRDDRGSIYERVENKDLNGDLVFMPAKMNLSLNETQDTLNYFVMPNLTVYECALPEIYRKCMHVHLCSLILKQI